MNRFAAQGLRVALIAFIMRALIAAATVALFTLALTVQRTWDAGRALADGELTSTTLKIDFLGLVSLTLTSVVFYLVAMSLLSLFVAPTFRVRGLHVRSLADLEVKVLNVVVVILATTFLERFRSSSDGTETLMFAGALALGVVAILGFQVVLRGREGVDIGDSADGSEST